jgi:hypothetical protein
MAVIFAIFVGFWLIQVFFGLLFGLAYYIAPFYCLTLYVRRDRRMTDASDGMWATCKQDWQDLWTWINLKVTQAMVAGGLAGLAMAEKNK